MKLDTILRGLAAPALAGLAGSAFAHPGHGLTAADSLMHMLEGEHLLPMLALLVFGVAFVGLRARLRGRDAGRRDTRSDPGRHD